ncbi:MAG: S-layer protein, partial [Eubacterium sp.]|nr:S-layer protein [Eubacterium sp.]
MHGTFFFWENFGRYCRYNFIIYFIFTNYYYMKGERLMKKKKLKIALSFFLALAIMLGSMPASYFTAYAYSGSGDGTSAATAFEIANVQELEELADGVNGGNNYDGVYFKLKEDIDFVSIPDWTPIGSAEKPFKGIFDGNGKTISNLTISINEPITGINVKRTGLFGVLGHNGEIKNLNLAGIKINIHYTGATAGSVPDNGTAFVGGLAGMNEGLISGCTVSGTLSVEGADMAVGGIVGSNGSNISSNTYPGRILDSSSDCTINAVPHYQIAQVGGIAGILTNATGIVDGCSSSGMITVTGQSASTADNGQYKSSPDAGGLVGYAHKAEIKNSFSSCKVTINSGGKDSHGGGLIGTVVDSIVDECYATGDVVSAGGENTMYYGQVAAGGLIGWSYRAAGDMTVSNSYSSGNASALVKSTALSGYAYAGGLIGHVKGVPGAVSISGCYSTGDAVAHASDNGYAFAGGFSGYMWPAAVEKSFASGDSSAVSAGNYAGAGGFAGYSTLMTGKTVKSSFTDCYSTGKVKANGSTAERAGGFAGIAINTDVTRSYSTGVTVKAHSGANYRIGGFIGSSDATAILAYCYTDKDANASFNSIGYGTPVGTASALNRDTMLKNDTLSADLTGLQNNTTWIKRVNESGDIRYYPELAIYYNNSSDIVKASSKDSVTFRAAAYLDHTENGTTSTTAFLTIQSAVDAAVDGDVVRVPAGSYKEQVTITKNITLQGAGMDQTIIESPDKANLTITGGNWKTIKGQNAVAIIGIKTDSDSGKVTVKNLTVDGRDQGYLVDVLSLSKGDYAFQGIGVFNSNADIDSVKVTRVRELWSDDQNSSNPLPTDYMPQDQPSGFNHNEAIFAESTKDSDAHTVTIKNSYITKFQKTGILVWGPTLFADIENNTVQGYGKTLYSTGNGIQIASSDFTPYGGGDRRGTTAVIRNNKILEIGVVIPEPGQPGTYLNLGLLGPGGILLYEAGNGIEITGNKITGPGVLPWHNSDTSNDGGYSNDGIIIYNSPNAYVANNEISDYSIGISEAAVDTSSKITVTGNIFSNNLMDIRTGKGNDEINLKDGSNIVSYYPTDNGIDTISNFGAGDAINVVGFAEGSVNGYIGTSPVYIVNTEGVQTINGYTDAHLVTDFTGGTVTNGDGTNVAANSVQISVNGKTTNLYIDTDGTSGAAELTVKLDGVYGISNFILDGGYIRFTGDAPSITNQPENCSITAGQTASFTVNVTGTAPLSYQWKKNGVDITDDSNISGANTATLTVSSAGDEDAGDYTCYISNIAGGVTSSAATLTVNPQGAFTLVTTPGSNHVNLNWNPVPEAAYYGIYKDGICLTTVAAIDLSFDAEGLVNGNSYDFFVRALDDSYVVLAESNLATAIPFTVPGIPADVTATAGNGQATVNFTAPSDNGGSPVTGYEVTASPGNIKVTTTTGTSIVVTGLSNGTSYTFTVRAINAAGSGAASAPSNEAIPATVPGVPGNVEATAGNGQATVTFTAPSDNGGSPVTGYEVTASPGNIKVTSTGTRIVVTGLSNGISYTFTVKAINSMGSSAASAPSNQVTPYGTGSGSSTPSAPTSSSSGSSSPPAPASQGVEVLVNGKAEYAGIATNTKQGDKTVTTITVDPVKLEQKLDKEGYNAKVTIPVKSASDIIIGELDGQMVKKMEAKAAVIEVRTDSAAYTLPAQQIRIDDISAEFGTNVELKDI